jgi:hypothetical protein
MASPQERICRALCKADGHPENIMFEGKPMWHSYRGTASAAFEALALEPLLGIVREVAESADPGFRERAQNAMAAFEGGR